MNDVEETLKFVTSITAPFSWIRQEGPVQKMRNGSAFFLDAGAGPFAVTAQHVITGWQKDFSKGKAMLPQIGCLPIDFREQDRIIDSDEVLDIFTFRIDPAEIEEIGKTVLSGRSEWPPPPPSDGGNVCFSGFPAIETLTISSNEYSFGATPGHGFASSVSETDVSSVIERGGLIGILGNGVPPEHYDFSGLSGGPMLAGIEHRGLYVWSLAGVIYQGPYPSNDTEIIKARRAHFILPDGKLDRSRPT